MAGSILAVAASRVGAISGTGGWRSWMPGLGLGLLAICFFLFDHKVTHPAIITTVPVFATCLIIWFAGRGDPVSQLLSVRPVIGIGLISYSLYLWHFPILALVRASGQEPGMLYKVVMILLAVLLSVASYYWVEKPFRNKLAIGRRILILTALSGTVALAGTGAWIINQDGVRSRFPDLIELYGKNEFDNEVLRQRSWDVLNGLAVAQGFGPSDAQEPSRFESEVSWFSDGAGTRLLVVGDSTSKGRFNALYLNAESFPAYQFARFGMSPRIIPDQVQALIDAPNFREADALWVSFNVTRENLPRITGFLRQLAGSGKTVYVSSKPPQFLGLEGLPIVDWFIRQKGTLVGFQRELAYRLFVARLSSPSRIEIDAELRSLADALGLHYLDLGELVCDTPKQVCHAITDDGYKVYFDILHWTLEGSGYLGLRMAEAGWFPDAGRTQKQ